MIGAGLPATQRSVDDKKWMRRALRVAGSATGGDIPVGAVIVGPDGGEIACGVNRREAEADPTAHAEIVAIREASRVLAQHGAGDGWRLEDCTLVVTLEPCAMCAGAAVAARMGRIVYGAVEPKTGACGSVWDIPRESPLHRTAVTGGVLREECEDLIREFFRGLRS